jgi:AcrR family transcriptional regulator
MPRYKEAEREQALDETRQRLVDAATEAFAQHGFDGANINQISTTAGYSKGTIYNYFESKRALMLALIQEIGAAHVDFVAQDVLDQGSASSRMTQFFSAGFAWVEHNVSQGRVMITTLHSVDAEFKNMMYTAYQPMFRLVREDILELGIEQGVFRPVDVGQTSGLIMTIYLGTSSSLDERGKPWMDAQQVADFIMHALRI